MDVSADLRLQTYAFDDEGREDEPKMELQSLEGPAIDHIRQLPNIEYYKM